MPKDDDLTTPRRLRAERPRPTDADVEVAEVEAAVGFGDSPGLDGQDMQAQGLIQDTLNKMMEEFSEHVQENINDGIDEVMDKVFGEDGTDGNGGTDDDAGSGDEGGSDGGDSGGSGDSGGGDSGGETQGLATGKRVHKPVFADDHRAATVQEFGDIGDPGAGGTAEATTFSEIVITAVGPDEGRVWNDDWDEPPTAIHDGPLDDSL